MRKNTNEKEKNVLKRRSALFGEKKLKSILTQVDSTALREKFRKGFQMRKFLHKF